MFGVQKSIWSNLALRDSFCGFFYVLDIANYSTGFANAEKLTDEFVDSCEEETTSVVWFAIRIPIVIFCYRERVVDEEFLVSQKADISFFYLAGDAAVCKNPYACASVELNIHACATCVLLLLCKCKNIHILRCREG